MSGYVVDNATAPKALYGPYGGDTGAGAVEHCQTTIIDQNMSVHRALNELGGAEVAANLPRCSKSSGGGAAAANAAGMRRSRSSGGVVNEDIMKRAGSNSISSGFVSPRSMSNARAASPHVQPTVSSPLLGKQVGGSLLEYYTSGFIDSPRNVNLNTIRFQVLVWHIGQIDMVQGRVPVTFRVTIFWNFSSPEESEPDNAIDDTVSQSGSSYKSQQTWQMLGRQKAIQTDVKDIPGATLEIPPVSILNTESFETIGPPEVSMLREDTRLMRWSCMYRAVLFQEHWDVGNFPHDEHEISLRLAVLAHRQPGSQWDRNVWKLALANADDSQGSVRVPYGLVVDHVSIPEFSYNKAEGLQFGFKPLNHGPGGEVSNDICLEVKLRVLRNSSYYDRNIMPLLGMLNLVAVSITALEAQNFFERALLTLNITFVEIGMRMTADSKLPAASYQIKMTRIMNEYFFGLLFLVLESLLVYELHEYGFSHTGIIDWCAALAVFSHNAYTLYTYYSDARQVSDRVLNMSSKSKGILPLA